MGVSDRLCFRQLPTGEWRWPGPGRGLHGRLGGFSLARGPRYLEPLTGACGRSLPLSLALVHWHPPPANVVSRPSHNQLQPDPTSSPQPPPTTPIVPSPDRPPLSTANPSPGRIEILCPLLDLLAFAENPGFNKDHARTPGRRRPQRYADSLISSQTPHCRLEIHQQTTDDASAQPCLQCPEAPLPAPRPGPEPS